MNKKYPPPSTSPTYFSLVRHAREDGVATPLRQMCMLLQAPADLQPLGTVLHNIGQLLANVPSTWPTHGAFAQWDEVVSWARTRPHLLIDQAGKPLTCSHSVSSPYHPRHRSLTYYPIFSALCASLTPKLREGPSSNELAIRQNRYRLLQAHLLMARWRDLLSLGLRHTETLISEDESQPGTGHLLEGTGTTLRSPLDAARAIRYISRDRYAELRAYIPVDRPPDTFGAEIDLDNYPRSDNDFLLRLRAIKFYCEFARRARKRDRAGDARDPWSVSAATSYFCSSYYGRYPTESDQRDDDDLSEDGASLNRLVYEKPDTPRSAGDDSSPHENASTNVLLLTEDVANQGSDPALHAERRADLRFLDIDSALIAVLDQDASPEGDRCGPCARPGSRGGSSATNQRGRANETRGRRSHCVQS